jgi:nitrite reductase/ring-hydroxylating ferredoxin subunit
MEHARETERTRLCALEDVAEGDAKGFVARVASKQRNIFVVRKDGGYLAYLNYCPHAKNLLDHTPGVFFNADRSLLRCSFHGALFRIDDGFCVEGPCEGENLSPLELEIADGALVLVA